MDVEENELPTYGSISDDKEEKNVEKTKEKKTPTGQWKKLATLAFGCFCVGASVSIQSPFFPQEAESKGSTPTEYGFIFGIYNLTQFLTAPIFGILVTIFSPKYILNFGVLTVTISSVLFGTLDLVNDTTTFVTFAFLLRILEGIGSAALRTSSCTIVAVEFPDGIGRAYALLQTSAGVGIIVAPTVGGALHDVGGFGLPFFVLGGFLFVDALVIFFSFPKTEMLKNQEKVGALKFLLHPTSIIFLLGIFTSTTFNGYNAATLEPHTREFQLSGFEIGLVFSLGGVLFAFSASGFGWVADQKFCNNAMLCFLGCLLTMASICMIGPAPFLFLNPKLWYIFVAQTLVGIGMGAKQVSAYTGLIKSIENRGFPVDIGTYGLVSSSLTSTSSIGSFVGPSLGGYLFDNFGYQNASMFVLSLEALLAFLLIGLIISNKCCGKKTKLILSDDLKTLPSISQEMSEKYVENGNNNGNCLK